MCFIMKTEILYTRVQWSERDNDAVFLFPCCIAAGCSPENKYKEVTYVVCHLTLYNLYSSVFLFAFIDQTFLFVLEIFYDKGNTMGICKTLTITYSTFCKDIIRLVNTKFNILHLI